MSFQADLKATLASVSSIQKGNDIKFYAQAAPEDVEVPFVVYRILNKDTIQTLDGGTDQTRYSLALECYALSYAEALSLAETVTDSIEASALISFRESAPGEEYIPEVDEFMEPVYMGFFA